MEKPKKSKSARRRFGKSIYSKLIIAFIVAMLPIYVLAIFLYSWGTSMFRQDILKSAHTQAFNYVNDLGHTFKRFNTLQYETMNDEMVIRLMNAHDVLEPYRQIELINSIRSKLFSIKNSSDLISDVRVYMPQLKIQISAVEGYSQLEPDLISASLMRAPYKVIFERHSYLIEAYPLEDMSGSIPDLIVEVELNEREMRRSIEAAVGRDYTGAIMLSMSQEGNIAVILNPELTEWLNNHMVVELPSKASITDSVSIDGKQYIHVRSAISETGLFLDQYLYKNDMFRSVTERVVWFSLFFVITFLAVALFLFYINKAINKPLVRIVRAFRHVEDGNFDFNIRHAVDDEFGDLYQRYNEMLAKLKTLIEEVYDQQLHRQNAELKQLQSQINPHFLYNCLFSIIRLIKMDKQEEAVKFTDQLAQYFRFITRSTRDTVPLEQEAEHARNYVMLQLARFSDRVSVEYDQVPDTLKPISVPRLIMQPLVENAFEHGLERVDAGGILRVRFSVKPDRFMIIVEDNGEDADQHLARLNELLAETNESREVTAILNIHRRLAFTFGAGSGIQAERSELGGIKVSIMIVPDRGDSHVQDVNR
ncbi:sensor histidine kinase [Cohnella sp. GbtcB17]|uniref:sensor histidine kinase n=1 Tax=Cohnella sp. GbtcB17 TaxID=2824762 RepID=UPI001C2FB502|nr:histidine kinase [Cohnella sp. GbtcB17]